MTPGPTQSYGQAAPTVRWRPRPVLAVLVRLAATLGPVLVALALGASAARWVPAERLGLPGPAWLLLVVAASSGVLFALSRWLRRLLPLSALLRLSLVVPDKVPSRFAVARRTWSPSALPRASADGAGEWLLDLVGALAAHDQRTRAHAERVQAYAALIGREMGLPAQDVDRLSWVALLHDVGKVHVPVEIINGTGRPSEEEWACLQQHPAHGGQLVEPLRGWLGDWIDGVVQHHERWDGEGYPAGLAGTGISLAARVIAVADTYDVITSARSYKKPMTAEQARAELTRCAGTQFDPDVVRALLGVGIGRLRFVAGPTTLLASLPGVGAAPAQAASGLSAAAQTAGGHLLGAVLTASLGVGTGAVATGAVAGVLPVQVAQAAVAGVAGPALPSTTTPPSPPPASPPPASATPSPATALPGTAVDAVTAWTPRAGSDPFRPSSVLSGTAAAGTAASPADAAPGTTSGTPGGTPSGSPSGSGPAAPAPAGGPAAPTTAPSPAPTSSPAPTPDPTRTPTGKPTGGPTATSPTSGPTRPPTGPTTGPTTDPTRGATGSPTGSPTGGPTGSPTGSPTSSPTGNPTGSPTKRPTNGPTTTPTGRPTTTPTGGPTTTPTGRPTTTPTATPTRTVGADCARARTGAKDLSGARLQNCDLSRVVLNGADLRRAVLDGADLTVTDLRGAKLSGASFRGAVLDGTMLNGATYDLTTFAGALVLSVVGDVLGLLGL